MSGGGLVLEPPTDREALLPLFRRAMSRFATGVTVLTTVDRGVDHAMTANSLTSVSLDPMLVLVCVETEARFHDPVVAAGVWGVSVLPASARGAADWMASRGRPLSGQLDQVPHTRGPATGVALIDGALAHLQCRTRAVHPGGDHSIVVGEVVAVGLPQRIGPALIFYRGQYGQVD